MATLGLKLYLEDQIKVKIAKPQIIFLTSSSKFPLLVSISSTFYKQLLHGQIPKGAIQIIGDTFGGGAVSKSVTK